ncbi:MAG: hypothetical protein WDM85_09690 [Caulobacteraceae bacterium]
MPTKLPHYVLPTFGALAWLMAAALRRPLDRRERWIGAGLAVAVGSGSGGRRRGRRGDVRRRLELGLGDYRRHRPDRRGGGPARCGCCASARGLAAGLACGPGDRPAMA